MPMNDIQQKASSKSSVASISVFSSLSTEALLVGIHDKTLFLNFRRTFGEDMICKTKTRAIGILSVVVAPIFAR